MSLPVDSCPAESCSTEPCADPLQPQPPQLGPRLGALYQWIAHNRPASRWDNIWDCCCDHGYLGMQILKNRLSPRVHFVDQASHLIEALPARLELYGVSGYETQSADAGQLRLAPDQSHLLIIAGIGGELSVSIVSALLANHPEQTLDFLFCPTTTQFDLRQYLAHGPFDLLHEALVSEKGQDYEVIAVRRHAHGNKERAVTVTGEHWDLSEPAHHRYLTKLTTHYRRCTRGAEAAEAQRILDCYLATWDRFAL